jgi:uracil phosphoribosyltransferase
LIFLGFLNLFPDAPVLHLGIYREKVSHQPVEYYNKLPDNPNVDLCYVLDPVIATGNTAVATINILKEWGMDGSQIKFVAVVAVMYQVVYIFVAITYALHQIVYSRSRTNAKRASRYSYLRRCH